MSAPNSANRRAPAPRAPRPIPAITYPEALPVSARRDEIARAISAHQVVIVSGETGSGKTTQLPKICLELGRGRRQMIAHTQPRRLAATSVARRVAEELGTALGEVIGYQIRFSERAGPGVCVKLMTDGVLLAESQRDRALRRYDTIIIDEAHERSLNIDFLLGYLKSLLARRPELKLIITSATLDAERFARHFADAQGAPAPVIAVSGRLYPVEVRYRPIRPEPEPGSTPDVQAKPAAENPDKPRDEERDLIDAVLEAVEECARHGEGDILVFLPGEREIREAAEGLRKHHPAQPVGPRGLDILPLYARLSQAEQARIFHPQGNVRRVVLATNVAETSLTVPGIRYVVDSGLARIKRYAWRSKVEQLRIEPISQAAAAQRAGRCGRVGPGLCIRLYEEADFARRPAFSEPEILRASLASVILRMQALGLDAARFPFVDAPSGRALADGYQLLSELGAITASDRDTADKDAADQAEAKHASYRLTPLGRELARLPADPRIARMILAARDQQCLREVLIIAAALSVQDPRERPLAAREAAEAAHAKFSDPRSEFLSWLKLWQWYGQAVAHKGSQRKLVARLRGEFLSPVRLREWHDIHSQLAALVGEQGWRVNQTEATYEQIHSALLAGLLGNIGYRGAAAEGPRTGSPTSGAYQGARDIRFYLHPGSTLAKKGGPWVLAAELVETTRLYARGVARIEPVWIERVAAHLLRRSYSEPRWEKKAGQVVANERATLYGLPVYSGRRVHYGRIDPARSREIFIRDGLVAGELPEGWASKLAFVAHNRQLVADIEQLEHRARRPDILVDDTLIAAFYARHIPAHICQAATLAAWVKALEPAAAEALKLRRDDLMRHEAQGVTTEVFPKTVRWHGVDMALAYHFEPGSPRDGVTLRLPLAVLNQVDGARCEWLVPGMLKEKVLLLLRTLPQKLRRHCVPIPDYAAGFHARWYAQLEAPGMGLIAALMADLHETVKIRVQASDFKPEQLPAHLTMNFAVLDEHGRVLGAGRNLAALRAEFGRKAQAHFQNQAARHGEVAQVLAHEQLTAWTFGRLPELLEIRRAGQTLLGYPALVDQTSHCQLNVYDDPQLAHATHRLGLLRLFRLALREPVRFQEKNLPELTRMGMLYLSLGTQEELREQLITVALAQACLVEPWPTDAETFSARCADAKTRLGLLCREAARLALSILSDYAALQKKLPQAKAHAAAYADLQQQLAALMPRDFLAATPPTQRAHLPRYLQAASARIDKLRRDPARDARLMAELAPLLAQYQRARAARKGAPDAGLDDFGWLLEELRVALYAQELRTPMPVSVKRLQKAWAALQR